MQNTNPALDDTNNTSLYNAEKLAHKNERQMWLFIESGPILKCKREKKNILNPQTFLKSLYF